MIIKGDPAGNVGFWSKHLLRTDTNDSVKVMEIKGRLSADVPKALREMELIAAQSRSEGNFMYQANINPQEWEHLTQDQWREAVDILEKNLGLEGHQRIVVEHEKEGRTHRHVIWNRVDVESLLVADMGGNYRIHTKTSRELEDRFDLTPTPTPTAAQAPAPELWEIRAGERSGIDPKAMKDELTEVWRSTETGRAFAAEIERRGYILAKGDRRDFCVIDRAGDAHSLARRLDGVKAKDVRERMADVDRDSLPSVVEARSMQRANHTPALGEAAAQIRLAWNTTRSADDFAQTLDGNGWTLARVDAQEAEMSQRIAAFAKQVGRYAPRYAEGEIVAVNEFGNVVKLNERTTGQPTAEVAKRLGALDQKALLNLTDARDAIKEASRNAFIEKKQAERSATPTEKRIIELRVESPTNGAFVAALHREGLTIAIADKAGILSLDSERQEAAREERSWRGPKTLNENELVAIDRAGGVHRLNPKKVDCVDLFAALNQGTGTVPTLSSARAALAEARRAPELGEAAAQVRLAWNTTRSADTFKATLEAEGWKMARVDAQEAETSQRVAAFAKQVGRYAPRYAEGEFVAVNGSGNVVRLDERTTGQSTAEITKRLGALDKAALSNLTDTRDAAKEASRNAFIEKKQAERSATPIEKRINELRGQSRTNGAFAAALYRDGLTIAIVDVKGILDLRIERKSAEYDDRPWRGPKTLTENELVAIDRSGGVHQLNPKKVDCVDLYAALNEGARTVPTLSSARTFIAEDRAAEQAANGRHIGEKLARKHEKEAEDHKAWLKRRKQALKWADKKGKRPLGIKTPLRAAKTPLRMAKGVGGVGMTVIDFVGGLLGGEVKPTRQQREADEIAQQRTALEAVENIRESIERGEGLKPEDIQNLTDQHLENIRLRGDDYIRDLAERAGRSRERYLDWGRERER